ncbi:MAG: GatB/YqeY domain-containing protein [Gammaproteobacteria bacterium]|nr:GatB/YqeY domain-containing protein [Gammaproteobacteria bacterium]
MSDLQTQISEATKVAMKARDKKRVAALRLVHAEFKRVEVDERRDLDDEDVLSILNRMPKQRSDSLTQFRDAGRVDLADQERFEIDLIRGFMPEPLSEEELDALIAQTIAAQGAESMKDMGKVMGALKSAVGGRADMGAASGKVKALLTG